MSRRLVSINSDVCDIVTLDEMKNYLKLGDFTEDDALIASMIRASTLKAEDYLWASLTEKTWEEFFNCYQRDYQINHKITSVESVKYYDENNADQTLVPTTDYLVFDAVNPALIRLLSSISTYDRPDAVRITYKTGAILRSDVDERAVQAVRWVVTEMYSKRMNDIAPLMTAFHRLLFPIRNQRF